MAVLSNSNDGHTKAVLHGIRRGEAQIQPIPALTVHGLHEWRGHTATGIEWAIHRGDAEQVLASQPANWFDCVITSPPYYWQRDYKVEGQMGLEKQIDQYVDKLCAVMGEVKRVLKKDGLLFLNLGDTYYSAKGQPKGKDRKNQARRFGLRAVDASGLGVPRKTTIGIPWRVALKMISLGWVLRSPIIWQRQGCLPEPTAKDRPWRTYEHLFMFSKTPKYYFERSALGDDEDIWTINDRPQPSNGVHSAAFPDRLVEKCLATGCRPRGRVLDPFVGSGTVLRVSLKRSHACTGIDISDRFCQYCADQLKPL